MKRNYISIFFCILLFSSIFISCDQEKNDSSSPEIKINAPNSIDMPAPGSTVGINAQITDNEEVHHVQININAENNPDTTINITFEHIHNPEFDIDTSFIANIHTGIMSNYTIEIIAEDQFGNSSSESVTFHVMGMGSGICSACGTANCPCDPNTCQCTMGNCSCGK